MPLILLALLIPLLPLLFPLLLVQRYRVGKARRKGRRWAARLGLILLTLSCFLFFIAAAFINFWAPRAVAFSLVGLGIGVLLGCVGLRLTRWEETPRGLFYTPNRWLILFLSLAVAARLLFATWKAWHTWRVHGTDASWIATAGVPGSLAVGAMVLGYYLSYNVGLDRRLSPANT
ncbi:MAG: DUF1453 domain-containing protein [Chthoniobacterales bacterium]